MNILNKKNEQIFAFLSMNKLLILLIVFFSSTIYGQSQNLIPNSGFDSIKNCPFPGSSITDIVPYWFSANNLTPDIFNRCAKYPSSGVPFHWFGHAQESRSGDGYAGINVYSNVESTGIEYLEVKLIESLKKNQNYFIRYFVSPMTNFFKNKSNFSVTDAMGLKFTDTLFYNPAINSRFYEPSINNRNGFIRDTVGWTAISGCFKAKGGESYATIGNFTPNDKMLIETDGVIGLTSNTLYFYIDNVSVLKFDPLPDTLILCKGESKTYNAALLESIYRWSTGKTDSIETITKPGRYIVDATIEGCVMSDTVIVIDPSVSSGMQDTVACKEKKGLELKVDFKGNYLWSTGDTTQSIRVTKPDNYSVTVTNECGTFAYTSRVDFEECGCRFYAPTAFSANGDSNNDTYKPIIDCKRLAIGGYKFSVFNRQGEQVYFTQNIDDAWDGTFRGQQCDVGVFAWMVEYTYEEKGITKTIIDSGDVTLLK
jgi:gliding motility-associated-like protein